MLAGVVIVAIVVAGGGMETVATSTEAVESLVYEAQAK